MGYAGRSELVMESENRKTEVAHVGLCADCQYLRVIRSDRGSTFYFCERSRSDPSLPKYPRLPLIQCSGYQRKTQCNQS